MKFAVFAAGFGAMMVQLILLRELMSIFEGNEWVLGIALGNWMLLMGLGAWLGRWEKLQTIHALACAQILQAVLPVITVFLLRVLRHVIFLRGSTIGIGETFLSCLLALLPFCLSAGCFLVLISNWAEKKSKNKKSVGEIYAFDNWGCVAGGFVFTIFALQAVDHFTALSFAALANLAGVFLIARAEKQKSILFLGGATTLFLLLIYNHINLDGWSIQREYPEEKIVFHSASPYGDILVTQTAGQYNFLQNGVPLFSSQNIESREEAVHFAMAQKTNAQHVLVLGGGITGTAKEILKYPVQSVDVVELDSTAVHAAKKFIPENFNDPRIHIIQEDARFFLKKTARRYDVILAGAPEPSTLQFNRFYTEEFFKEVKSKLNAGGVFSFVLGNYENYLSKELTETLAITSKTLQNVFKNILLLPGNRVYFLASESDLTPDIAQALESGNIPTQWINRHYLRAIFTPERLAELKNLPRNVPINRDFNPALYFHHLHYWLSRFQTTSIVPGILLLLCILIYLFRLKSLSFSVFTTGFSAAGIELILLAGFQIIYGSLYHKIGVIITIFMLGIASGSFLVTQKFRKTNANHLRLFILLLALYACALPWFIALLKNSQQDWMTFFFPTLIPALLTGMIFPLAVQISPSSAPASPLYQADYVGAFLGFLFVNAFLLPILGFKVLCLLIAALCMLSLLMLRRT